MNNKVIYTSLVGRYDILRQPRCIHPEFDYICFSNDLPQQQAGVWSVREIPWRHPDSTRLSRYAKLNPHKVLQAYTHSLWIDANFEIMDGAIYNRVLELSAAGALIAHVPHYKHDCIYDDIASCIRLSKDTNAALRRQYRFLKQEGYPAHYGLFENGLIYRQHNEQRVIAISESWWQQYMQFSRRDQLSLCYVYWKHDFRPDLLLPPGVNTRNSHCLQYHLHPQQKTPLLISAVKKVKWIVKWHRKRKERIIASLTKNK